MPTLSVGDLAGFFAATRHTSRLKTGLATLTQELGTGQSADLVARMGGDTGRLLHIDRRLSLIESHSGASQETAQTLAAMQAALAGLEGERAGLALQILGHGNLPGKEQDLAGSAEASFVAMVRSLNFQAVGKPLFAGTAHISAALAAPEDMLADLAASLAGANDAQEVIARVSDWFNAPTGGFATMGYLGDDGVMRRSLGDGQSVVLDARADDPAVRGLLEAVALTALIGRGALAGDIQGQRELIQESGRRLLAVTTPLVGVQARLGAAEARTDEALARLSAERAALMVARNDTAAADPFETASKLEEMRQQLERHYLVTARLSRLSLAEYLR